MHTVNEWWQWYICSQNMLSAHAGLEPEPNVMSDEFLALADGNPVHKQQSKL